MEKFIQAIHKAQKLGISTLYMYWSEGIENLVLNDTRKQEKELAHLKNAYTEAIMNSRDDRIRMQRELAKLTDIEIWEPENFTDEMHKEMARLREGIANHRAKETQYINAKEGLI